MGVRDSLLLILEFGIRISTVASDQSPHATSKKDGSKLAEHTVHFLRVLRTITENSDHSVS